MAFSDDNLAELKARVRLSDFVASRVKLTPGKGDRFGLCPFHSERSGSFSVNDAKGFFHCFGCGAHGDVLDWWQKIDGMSFADARQRLRREAGAHFAAASAHAPRPERDLETEKKQVNALAIWQASQPIGGTLAERYLRQARGIGIELPDCLRFHPSLPFDPGRSDELPALVASVTDLSGAVVAIQRTFLRSDGLGKAPIERPKRALGPVALGAVRLGRAGSLVGLAEGIETGLSAMQLFAVPVWCALGSNLARISLPEVVAKVAIFADRGEAGERAADAACRHFRSERRKVVVRYASAGKDFNDELRVRRRGP